MHAPTSSPQTQPAPIAMPPVIIVADDLTGACDTAAAFLGQAKTVRMFLNPGPGGVQVASEPETVGAVSTETRNLTRADAVRVVEQAIAPFAGTDRLILLKKIDSAGRGHIGAETMAALRASGSALALVAPAFPAAGRTVVNGVLHIRDSAEQNTCLPLISLFDSVDRPHVEHLPSGTESHLQQAILGALSRGARVLICDAETQDDFVRLATAAYGLPKRILWTGSAGLARALASILPRPDLPLQRDQAWPEGRILIFVGTDHPVTQRQIQHLHGKARITSTQIHSINWNKGSADGVRAQFTQGPVSALIVTGGDTAAFVLAQLNARAICLIGELAPGVPWGLIEGGDADGCAVVTKSGGFGDQETLADAFNFCSRRVCEPA